MADYDNQTFTEKVLAVHSARDGTFGRDLRNKFGDVNTAAVNEKDSIGSAHAESSSGTTGKVGVSSADRIH